MLQSQQPGVGKVKVGKSDQEKAQEKKDGVTLYVSLFLDGTKNNRYNTTLRINANNALAKKHKSPGYVPSVQEASQLDVYDDFHKEVSYQNYYSNVALLSYMNKKRRPDKKEISVYVEGAGTDFVETRNDVGKPVVVYSGDTTAGSGFGTGDTGIPEKVTKGIQKIREQVKRQKLYDPRQQYIEEIKVDVFGFSRGAAAARHFVHRRQELSKWPGQQAARVTVQFVGLFDTVSSYGASFLDDVGQLGLAVGGQARKVVHLVAGDECRENFASTNIKSSIAAGVGYELVLPGVHSDVGGGYAEVEKEERMFLSPRNLDPLVRDGWFYQNADVHKSQVAITRDNYGDYRGYTARTVYYHYQLIPLALMVALAHQSGLGLELADFDTGSASFTEKKANPYNVPAELVRLRQEMHRFAVAHDRPQRQAFALPLTAEGKMVRNRYLHRSELSSDIISAPHLNKQLFFERQPIDG